MCISFRKERNPFYDIKIEFQKIKRVSKGEKQNDTIAFREEQALSEQEFKNLGHKFGTDKQTDKQTGLSIELLCN